GDAADEAAAVAAVPPALREPPLDLALAHAPFKPVAGAQRLALATAQPLDLARRDDAAVRVVTPHTDATLPVPPAQGVEADPECPRPLARRVFPLRQGRRLLHRHYLCNLERRHLADVVPAPLQLPHGGAALPRRRRESRLGKGLPCLTQTVPSCVLDRLEGIGEIVERVGEPRVRCLRV